MSGPEFEMGDEAPVEYTEDDCSVEFEQGEQGLLDVAKARMDAYWLDRVMG
jgi:hypothetical protein